MISVSGSSVMYSKKSAAFRSEPLPKLITFEQRMPRGAEYLMNSPAFIPDCESMPTGPGSAPWPFIIASRAPGT
jgi:hypothetical protein